MMFFEIMAGSAALGFAAFLPFAIRNQLRLRRQDATQVARRH
jgi:hypothetical protein